MLQTETLSGAALKLIYDKALDTGSVPDADDFSVKVAGSAVSLAASSPVAVSGSAVTLNLAAAPAIGQSVTVSYTAGTNPIQDKAGNDAANLSDRWVSNGDTTPPVLQTATVTGAALTLTYSETLDTDSVPDADDFTVKVAGSAVSLAASSPVAVSGSTVSLNLASAAGQGEAVTVSYTADTKPIRDREGNDAANLTDHGVTNTIQETTPPALQSATVDGASWLLWLTYDEPLNRVSVPDADDFTVKVAGSAVSLTDTNPVSIHGSAVSLRLAAVVSAGQTVTVSYAAGTKPIRDRVGNDAANLTDRNVTNNTAAGSVPSGGGLVSNTGQADGYTSQFGISFIQPFTTGSASAGYKLTDVVLHFRDTAPTLPFPSIDVSIRSVNGTQTGGRLGTLTNPSTFRSGPNTFSASGAGIDLEANTTYAVVAAADRRDSGISVYMRHSSSGSEDSGGAAGWSIANTLIYGYTQPLKIGMYGSVKSNVPPSFPEATATELTVAENSAEGGAVGTVAATDAEGDTLAYSLDETSDAVFDIDSEGAITVAADAALDFESDTTSYAATVSVSDGVAADASEDATADATHAVTITVTDVDEPPPAPDAPTLTGASKTSMTVAWTAPEMAGKPAISDYDLQYRKSGAEDWTDAAFDGTTTSATISGLTPGATYEAQVRATNDEGTGEWSATGSGALSGALVAFTNKPASGGYAAIGSHVEVTATFNHAVTVTGTPRIELSPAFGPNGETRHADYVSGSTTASLVFRYTLVEGDNSAGTNVSVAEDALDADGADGNATIRNASAEDVAAAHAAADSGLAVAVARPTIVRAFGHPVPGMDADLDGSGETYVEGDSFSVKVRFSDDMSVTGAGTGGANVQVVVAVGSTDYTLNHVGTDGTELEFGTHTVVAADMDTDGIAIRRD